MPSPPDSPRAQSDRRQASLASSIADTASITALSRQMDSSHIADSTVSSYTPGQRLPTPPNDDCDRAVELINPLTPLPTTILTFPVASANSAPSPTDSACAPSPTLSSWSFDDPSWPADPADDSHSHTRHDAYRTTSHPSLRRARQDAVRRQCSTTHLREIEALVARMVDAGAQCCVCLSREPVAGDVSGGRLCAEPTERDDDASDAEMDMDDGGRTELGPRRPTSRDGAAARPVASRRQSSGVSKADRLGLVMTPGGVGRRRKRATQ